MASRYEIKFSDAARADFERLQAEAESCAESSSEALRQLLEVHALLDQIAEGDPAEDALVPGNLTEPAGDTGRKAECICISNVRKTL
jgi:hypothetical protein